jgi:hypothetical protein
MTYGQIPYAHSPYAGAALDEVPPPNQVIPPPIPGGTTTYEWVAENGFYPWTWTGWAGARLPMPSLPGGLVVVPHQETGIVEVMGWWPDAAILQFIRITDDGTRTPVRGGYGVVVEGATRVNSVSNPSFETGLNGWVPGTGSPTLSRPAGGAAEGDSYMRAVRTGVGSIGLTAPLASYTPAATATVSVALRFPLRPTSLTATVSWQDSGGGALTSNVITFTADEINECVSQWARLTRTVTPPAGAVTPGLNITVGGVPAGGAVEVDAVVLEAGTSDGSYFDGDMLAAIWLGVTDLSASLLSPIVTINDADCPLDVPVTYMVADPSITGGYAVVPAITLPSVGRFCWLTHPARAAPMRCDLREVPTLQREIDQGVFWPIGRRHAVTVSSRRRSATADLVFNAMSFSERDALLDFMDDGTPLLLRAPASFGYGPGRWWALGTVTEDRESRLAHQDAMILTAHSTEVDTPSPFIEVIA